MILLFIRCGTPRGRDGARHDLTQAHRGLVSRDAVATPWPRLRLIAWLLPAAYDVDRSPLDSPVRCICI